MAAIHCPWCQADVPNGALSCPRCGSPVTEEIARNELSPWPDPISRRPPSDVSGKVFTGCLVALAGSGLGLFLGVAVAFIPTGKVEAAGLEKLGYLIYGAFGALIGCMAGFVAGWLLASGP